MASNIFTGASRYSQDFQSVIDRAVNIASLPMLQMQQSKATASDQASALKVLDAKVSALQNSLKGIGDSFRLRFVFGQQLRCIHPLCQDQRRREKERTR